MSLLTGFRQYRNTIATALVLGLLASARHAGVMLLLVWPILILYGLAATVKAIRNPELRNPLLVKASIWVFMSVLVVSWHLFMHHSTRDKAQQIADKIESFRALKGVYPVDISDIGMSYKEMKAMLGLSYYINKDGKVIFGYASTFVPFEYEEYDFASQAWAHSSD